MPRKKTIKRKRYRRKTRGGDRTVDDSELRSLLNMIVGEEGLIVMLVLAAKREVDDIAIDMTATDEEKTNALLYEIQEYLDKITVSLSRVKQKLARAIPLNYTRDQMTYLQVDMMSNLQEILSILRELPGIGNRTKEFEPVVAFIEDKFTQILQLY
jgi:hypothetical protein